MKFGTTEDVQTYGDDGEVSTLSVVHHGIEIGRYKRFKVRHIIKTQQEHTAVSLQFELDIKDKRDTGTLAYLKDDPSTNPMIMTKYPKTDIDGSYMIVTSWMEKI